MSIDRRSVHICSQKGGSDVLLVLSCSLGQEGTAPPIEQHPDIGSQIPLKTPVGHTRQT